MKRFLKDPGNGLLLFLASKTMIMVGIASAAALLTDGFGLAAAIGVAVGALIALYRIWLYGRFLGGLTESSNSFVKTAVYPIVSLIFLFLLLVVSILTEVRLFIGMTAGVLIVPLIIFINAITEGIGITHNRWGQKGGGNHGTCD